MESRSDLARQVDGVGVSEWAVGRVDPTLVKSQAMCTRGVAVGFVSDFSCTHRVLGCISDRGVTMVVDHLAVRSRPRDLVAIIYLGGQTCRHCSRGE